jgi:hypothetical protein
MGQAIRIRVGSIALTAELNDSARRRPRAASAVNPIGQVQGDVSSLRQAADGAEVVLEKA